MKFVGAGQMQIFPATCKSAGDETLSFEKRLGKSTSTCVYEFRVSWAWSQLSLCTNKMLTHLKDVECVFVYTHAYSNTQRLWKDCYFYTQRAMKYLVTGKKLNANRNRWKTFQMPCCTPFKTKHSFQRNMNVCVFFFKENSWLEGIESINKKGKLIGRKYKQGSSSKTTHKGKVIVS